MRDQYTRLMPREIITIGAGQCGNQLSSSFWEKLCLEHGIQPDGSLKQEGFDAQVGDRKDVFFYQSDDSRFIPRAVLVDLEPRVVQNVAGSDYGRIYNPENIFFPQNGPGAGNNWGKGYGEAQNVMETILDILDREAENSDSLEAFMLMHSVAGGTGSGLGSFLMESIRDRFPKTLLNTVSVFPSSGAQASDVVVQPYNSVLTLHRLIEHADASVIFDNNSLVRIANETLHLRSAQSLMDRFDDQRNHHAEIALTNSLMSTALLAATATIRFPGYMYNNWSSVLASMIPLSRYHFLAASYTPFLVDGPDGGNRIVRKTTVTEIVRRLAQHKYMMLGISPQAFRSSRYMAMLRVIQGDIQASEYRKQVLGMRENENIEFAPSFVASLQLAVAKRSPYVEHRTKLSGLGLINSTGVADMFKRTLKQFNQLYTRGAFLNEYRKQPVFGEGLPEFEAARDAISTIVKEYELMEKVPTDEPETEPAIAD